MERGSLHAQPLKIYGSPRRGTGFASHTKTLKMRVSRNFQLSPLPKIGEGFGEWSEAPSYEEGVGVDGDTEGIPSEKRGAGVEPCKRLDGDFTTAETVVMLGVIDDAELPGGYAMDALLGMDNERMGACPFQGGRMVLRGMTDFKRHFGGS